jgi:alpha 1,6-mannosyltransferase
MMFGSLQSRRLLLPPALLVIFAIALFLNPSHYSPSPEKQGPHPLSGTSFLAASSIESIPSSIWQIYFGFVPNDLKDTILAWITKNPDHSYVLMRDEGANAFVKNHYANRIHIRDLFLDLKLPVFRSDLLRYMILESEGGIYSDLDAISLRPIAEWIPEDLKSRARAVVGIEYDQLDDEKLWPSLMLPVQFCQWTLAASKGHPLMSTVVNNVAESIHRLARISGTTIANLNPADDEVTQTTGPVIWTTSVFEGLSAAAGEPITWQNITRIDSPRLYGDILVLPIDAFGTGQPHSRSTLDGAEDALVKHQFKGSWRHHTP